MLEDLQREREKERDRQDRRSRDRNREQDLPSKPQKKPSRPKLATALLPQKAMVLLPLKTKAPATVLLPLKAKAPALKGKGKGKGNCPKGSPLDWQMYCMVCRVWGE